MKYAIVLAFMPGKQGEGDLWLWSLHDANMKTITVQKPGYATPEAALRAAKECCKKLWLL